MRKFKLDELNRLSVDAFREQPKTPVHLILDNVRSGLNVGSAFRTADAFALAHIHLCGITAQPPHREILKTALGATEAIDWSHHPEVTACVRELKSQGFAVWAVEQAEESCLLQDFQLPDLPLALVFGNEVSGVSEEVMSLVDGALEIPQYGTKHSLNISVSLGIVVWDIFRQLRFPDS
ncbi:MAG: RNA methyltransferase [Lewinella sp.]|nr:RNA methyltransferase [Lewinella sp.]